MSGRTLFSSLGAIASNRPRSRSPIPCGKRSLCQPVGRRYSPIGPPLFRFLRDQADESGVLVVFNGVVRNDTSRKLDRSAFQGFALVDSHAPLVFVNAADFKAAQMFTLAHELAHLFIRAPGISNLGDQPVPGNDVERFCNAVAAEFLVPALEMNRHWTPLADATTALKSAGRRFKVSELVVARRAAHLGLIDHDEFREFYQRFTSAQAPSVDGGNFWHNQNNRIGRRFGGAVYRAAVGGNLAYREAYALTGLRAASFTTFMSRVEAIK